MKLRTLMLSAVLCTTLTVTAFADNLPAPKAKNVIDQFADSHMSTDANKLSKILSADATFKFTKGTEVLSQSHISILKQMRQNDGIKQNCTTDIEVLSSNDAMVMAKVNFIYNDFIIENYLTLELDQNQNWKITRINKFFKD
ncbi:MAG: nuclear transport factor 2 family protein [Pedobacter sp.]